MTCAATVVAPACATSAGADFRRFEIEVGALQREPALVRLDQHVGEDRDRVAALDDAMDMAERLQQGGSLDSDFHRIIIPIPKTPCAPHSPASTASRGADLAKATGGYARAPMRIPQQISPKIDAALRSRSRRLNWPLNRRLYLGIASGGVRSGVSRAKPEVGNPNVRQARQAKGAARIEPRFEEAPRCAR